MEGQALIGARGLALQNPVLVVSPGLKRMQHWVGHGLRQVAHGEHNAHTQREACPSAAVDTEC